MQNWRENYNILEFETLDSTNSEALRLASTGANGSFLIKTAEQTGGRGQRGREWVSIPENLHASILLKSDASLENNSQLSFLIANAMYDTISELASRAKLPLNIELKWPNDILINGKKIAGILLESISFENKTNVVIGFGVNIMKAPTDLDKPVTSLFDEGIKLENPEAFLDMLMNNFDRLYNKWCEDKNFVSTRNSWMQHAYNLNKTITINDGVRSVSGIFRGIDLDGALRLELPDGKFCTMHAGEMIIDKKNK